MTATIMRRGDHWEARLERTIGHGREAVWHMLTDAGALPRWLAPGEMEPCRGGTVQIDFGDSGTTIDSTVREFDPPSLLEYSWSSGGEPERPLRWELVPMDEGTHLTLTLCLPAHEDVAKAAAGWYAHLEMLLAALEGVPIRFPVDHFLEARQRYRDMLD